MAKGIKKIDLSNPAQMRKLSGENQANYWSRFHVTQSGGSRYEQGRNIPGPLKLLMALKEIGKITDDDLAQARAAVSH